MISGLLDRRATPYGLALVLSGIAIGAGLLAGQDPASASALVARWTARAAFPLFLLTYAASSLFRLWPGTATRALLRHRRHWGLGFALAHSIHLVALAINLIVFDVFRPVPVLIGGGLSYGLIYLMALTSNDASMRAMGRNWKRLHIIGIHYAWIIFFQSYAGAALTSDDPDKWITGTMFTGLLLAALALRITVWRKGRRALARAA